MKLNYYILDLVMIIGFGFRRLEFKFEFYCRIFICFWKIFLFFYCFSVFIYKMRIIRGKYFIGVFGELSEFMYVKRLW